MKLLVLLFFTLLPLGTQGQPSTDRRVVLVVVKAIDNPFFVEIVRGVTDELKRRGMTADLLVRSGAQEGDVTGQREHLESAIARYLSATSGGRLAGLVLTPSGSGDELTSQIQRLRAARVPVVLLDTRISKEALDRAATTYDMFAGSSNRQGGEIAATEIMSRLPRGGRILLLNGVSGHETAAERRVGFMSQLADQRKRRRFVVIERTANWRRSEAQAAVDGLLSMGRRFDAIFAANDEMALGALVAIERLPARRRPLVIGFDATPEARQAVADGKLLATVAQDPYAMGVSAVAALDDIGHDRRVIKDQIIPVRLIKRK